LQGDIDHRRNCKDAFAWEQPHERGSKTFKEFVRRQR